MATRPPERKPYRTAAVSVQSGPGSVCSGFRRQAWPASAPSWVPRLQSWSSVPQRPAANLNPPTAGSLIDRALKPELVVSLEHQGSEALVFTEISHRSIFPGATARRSADTPTWALGQQTASCGHRHPSLSTNKGAPMDSDGKAYWMTSGCRILPPVWCQPVAGVLWPDLRAYFTVLRAYYGSGCTSQG